MINLQSSLSTDREGNFLKSKGYRLSSFCFLDDSDNGLRRTISSSTLSVPEGHATAPKSPHAVLSEEDDSDTESQFWATEDSMSSDEEFWGDDEEKEIFFYAPDFTQEEKESHDQPLYEGCPLTVMEAMVAILIFFLRHHLTKAAFEDLLSLIAMFLKAPNFFKDTQFKFRKYFSDRSTPVTRHFNCSNCSAELESKDSPHKCDNPKISYFITTSIEDQLKKLFRKKGFYEDVDRSRENFLHDHGIRDIYDGQLYKELSKEGAFLSDKNSMSVMWYSDGASIFKSAKFSIWPIFFIINELPFLKRIQPENMILGGLWFGPHEPVIDLFLKPIYNQFVKLMAGVKLWVPNVGQISRKVMLLCGIGDTPARSHFLKHVRFNGFFGCLKCLQKGKTLREIHLVTLMCTLLRKISTFGRSVTMKSVLNKLEKGVNLCLGLKAIVT